MSYAGFVAGERRRTENDISLCSFIFNQFCIVETAENHSDFGICFCDFICFVLCSDQSCVFVVWMGVVD